MSSTTLAQQLSIRSHSSVVLKQWYFSRCFWAHTHWQSVRVLVCWSADRQRAVHSVESHFRAVRSVCFTSLRPPAHWIQFG